MKRGQQQLAQERDSFDQQYAYFSTVRVNADNSNKKALFLFWLLFGFLEITILITSNFTPQALITKTNKTELAGIQTKNCTNPVDFSNGMLSCQAFTTKYPKLGLIMRDLSPLNQFAQINLLFLPKNSPKQTLTVKQTFKVELMSLIKKQLPQKRDGKSVQVFEKGQDVRAIQNVDFDSSEHTLQWIMFEGQHRRGYEVNLGFYREFYSENALMVITFMKLEQQYLDNYDIVPEAVLMNKNYTIFTLVFRGCFLVAVAISFGMFLFRNRGTELQLEQRIVQMLSGTCILFNDPYYALGVFRPNLFSIFLSTTLVAVFLMALVISWIIMLQKIKTEAEGKPFVLTTRKKISYACIAGAYFSIMFYFIFEVTYYSFTKSPIIPMHSTFRVLYISTVLMSTLVFIYIWWLYFGIAKEWDKVSWRGKIYATFNVFFILLNLAFISLGWLSFYDESSQKLQIFYASMNFYVVYLQYMYSTPFSKHAQDGYKMEQPAEQKSFSVIDHKMITINLEEEDNKNGLSALEPSLK